MRQNTHASGSVGKGFHATEAAAECETCPDKMWDVIVRREDEKEEKECVLVSAPSAHHFEPLLYPSHTFISALAQSPCHPQTK